MTPDPAKSRKRQYLAELLGFTVCMVGAIIFLLIGNGRDHFLVGALIALVIGVTHMALQLTYFKPVRQAIRQGTLHSGSADSP